MKTGEIDSAPEQASNHDLGAKHHGGNTPEDRSNIDNMSPKQAINLIRDFSGQSNTITFSRAFLNITGDIPSALMLSQITFWAGRGADLCGWIWKRDQDWDEEVGISPKQALRARNNLKKQGFIKTKIKKAFGSPTLHYRICERNILESLVSYQRDETKHTKGMKRNTPRGRNETHQRDETLTDTTTNYTADTHTGEGVCNVTPGCFPITTGDTAKELSRSVMAYQIFAGKRVNDQVLYLATLEKAAKAGKLMIPKGYVPPAERAAKAAKMKNAEQERQAKENAEQAKMIEAEAKFLQLAEHDKQKYLTAARAEIGAVGNFPVLVQKRAEMLAFREVRW